MVNRIIIILLISCGVVYSICKPYSVQAAQNESVLGAWYFDNNDTQDSTGSNIATLYGGATIGNGVLNLDGTGGMFITDSVVLSPKQGISLALDISFEKIGSDFIVDGLVKSHAA